MEEAAKLVTAIAALVGALIWPVAVFAIFVIFRREIRTIAGKVPGIIDRVQTLKLGAVEAELRQLAQEVPDTKQRSGVVTAEQVRVAASVEVQSRDIENRELLKQMDRLAIEYDTIRRTMRGGQARTTQMTKILVQMRGLARAVTDSIEIYKSSGFPGSRLAAIAIMQMAPATGDLNWLRDRFYFEAPFIFYHAALALQNISNEADHEKITQVVDLAREVHAKISSFPGGGDADTLEVLDALLRGQATGGLDMIS